VHHIPPLVQLLNLAECSPLTNARVLGSSRSFLKYSRSSASCRLARRRSRQRTSGRCDFLLSVMVNLCRRGRGLQNRRSRACWLGRVADVDPTPLRLRCVSWVIRVRAAVLVVDGCRWTSSTAARRGPWLSTCAKRMRTRLPAQRDRSFVIVFEASVEGSPGGCREQRREDASGLCRRRRSEIAQLQHGTAGLAGSRRSPGRLVRRTGRLVVADGELQLEGAVERDVAVQDAGAGRGHVGDRGVASLRWLRHGEGNLGSVVAEMAGSRRRCTSAAIRLRPRSVSKGRWGRGLGRGGVSDVCGARRRSR